jgi:hypothetical protein
MGLFFWIGLIENVGAVRSRGEEREQMVAIDVYGPEILRSHLLVCMAVDTGKKNAGSCPTNMMNTCLLSLAMVFSFVNICRANIMSYAVLLHPRVYTGMMHCKCTHLWENET